MNPYISVRTIRDPQNRRGRNDIFLHFHAVFGKNLAKYIGIRTKLKGSRTCLGKPASKIFLCRSATDSTVMLIFSDSVSEEIRRERELGSENRGARPRVTEGRQGV